MKNVHGGDIYSYKNILDFSANINPFGTPESVMDAIKEASASVAAYPDLFCRKLRSEIAGREGIEADKIICGNGAADLIYRFIFAVKPKKAMVLAPSFSEYEQALKTVDCEIVYYELDKKTFQLTPEFLHAITSEIDLLCLCTPNNPTGLAIAPWLLTKIIKKCKEKDIYLLLDECFYDFLEKESAYIPYRDREVYPKLFTLRAFTKMYGLAGVRLGYGFCEDEKLIEQMYFCGPPWNVSGIAQAAGLAALREEALPAKTREYIACQKNYLYKEFDRLGITYWRSDANYIFFCAEPGLKEKMIDCGVLIRDCSNYRGLTEGYYRIAVKRQEENMQFLKALRKAIRRQ